MIRIEIENHVSDLERDLSLQLLRGGLLQPFARVETSGRSVSTIHQTGALRLAKSLIEVLMGL